ncbi:MAG TPA: MMPL family transporter [Pseudomonadales bacterium]
MSHPNMFVRLGRLMLAWPKTALAILLLELMVLVMQLPRLEIDTSIERFLQDDSRAILDYNAFRREFGRDEFFVVAITGEPVLTLDYLHTLKAFHEDLQRSVSFLQSVESLVNVRSIYGDGDDLIAEDLLQTMPETGQDLQQLEQRIRGKTIYYGRLINEAEDAVALLVKLVPYVPVKNADGSDGFHNLADAEMFHAYNEILALAEKYRPQFGDNAEIHVGGTPASGSYMSVIIQQDFTTFTVVALTMIVIVLWTLFRRLAGVIMPIVVMGIGIVSTISLMPVLGYPMQVTTSIVPSFLLAVSIGHSVHMLNGFFHHYDMGHSKKSSILYALNHVGMPVLFTSLTTAAGLITFAFSDILPIAGLGLFAALGSLLAFAITLLGLPVLLQLSPVKRKPYTGDDVVKTGSLLYRFTKGCVHLSTTYPKPIVAVAVVLMTVAAFIVPNIQFSQDSLEWFEDSVPVKRAIKTIEATITGSMPVEIVIDTGEAQGVVSPEFLQRMDNWLKTLEGGQLNGIPILSVNSITNLVRETNQAFNGNSPDAYVIPDDRELIAQELLLIEMDKADDLYAYTDRQFRKTRITLIVPWADAVLFSDFLIELEQGYQRHLGDDYRMHVTGVIPIFAKMFSAMIISAAQSYLVAAVAISLMMILFLRSLVDGLLSMIPNLLPIMLVLSYMVLIGLPLDVFTVLVGSVALGLCVDDTVHFMHGFKSFYGKHGDAARAIEQTLLSTGKALMITTIVLFFGFMTYVLSGLENMDNFGLLTASCIVLAFVADFLVAPALMMLRYGKKPA